MEIIQYPDGASYCKLEAPINRVIVFKVNNYEDLWHLNQIVDAYNNQNLVPTIIIPNLIDAQADRRFGNNESYGLKLVCQFLNKMHANFKIFHPHNLEVVEALMDNVEIIDNSKFINEVLEEVSNLRNGDGMYNQENLVLMSSDAGGFKPLMKLCDKINWQGETYSASKARLTGHSEARIVQKVSKQDFEGKDILIIDDICVYGGTFKGLATLLKERNCGKLYLAVSHMTVQNLGEDPVTNYFDKVFCTNSKHDEYFADGRTGNPNINNKLEIIKMF